MSTFKYRAVLSGLLALATPGVLGCGPDFPEELIPNRKTALFEPPPAWFSREVQKLAAVRYQDLPLAEDDDPVAQRTKLESEQLPAEVSGKIAAMRQALNGDAAYALGEGLPEALRLYTAAAVDYHRAFPPPVEDTGDATQTLPPALPYEQQQAILEQARQRFAAVLALPAEQNAERAVWARFMLGKIDAYEGHVADAAAQFQQVRDRVKAGMPDPLGLAVASLGEEARLHFSPEELEAAAGLYIRQLAYGSRGAATSLKFLAAKIINNDAWLDAALSRPLTQSLVFLYVYTQNVGYPFESLDNYVYNQERAAEEASAGQNNPNQALANAQNDADAAGEISDVNNAAAPDAKPQPDVWERIAAVLDKQPDAQVAGADWLAAVAYQKGRFDLAQRFADKDNSPLAYWIQAKLALRAGKQDAALAAYAQAAGAFPAEDNTPSDAGGVYRNDSLVYRVDAERGVLRLARGEYLQALTHLYAAASKYWTDTAYVAERVLTVNELKGFVDRQVKAPSAEQLNQALQQDAWNVYLPPAMQIRQLLARRLLRAGRVDEAKAYFDNPQLRTWAKDYGRLLARAHYRWQGDISRAEAWFALARFTRKHGMELLGYELAPDFANWGGLFAPAGGPEQIGGDFTSADEQRRFDANRADPEVRFHYRLVAADYAVEAADRLPHSSQAFAAVLCEATRWNRVRAPDYAIPLYRRYLREGPYVTWGKSFGQTCPEPDFPGAEKRQWAQRINAVKWPGYTLLSLTFIAAVYFSVKKLYRRRSQGQTQKPGSTP